MLDTYKELEPVLYGENAIKHLPLGPTFRNHWHDRIEMLYVTHGSFQLQLGDEQMILLPGQLAVISPRVLHTGTVLSEDSCGHVYVIMFDVEKLFNGAAASEKYLLPVCKGESVFSGVISDPEPRKNSSSCVMRLPDRPIRCTRSDWCISCSGFCIRTAPAADGYCTVWIPGLPRCWIL